MLLLPSARFMKQTPPYRSWSSAIGIDPSRASTAMRIRSRSFTPSDTLRPNGNAADRALTALFRELNPICRFVSAYTMTRAYSSIESHRDQRIVLAATAEAYFSRHGEGFERQDFEHQDLRQSVAEIIDAAAWAAERRDDIAHGIAWQSISVDGRDVGSFLMPPEYRCEGAPSRCRMRTTRWLCTRDTGTRARTFSRSPRSSATLKALFRIAGGKFSGPAGDKGGQLFSIPITGMFTDRRSLRSSRAPQPRVHAHAGGTTAPGASPSRDGPGKRKGPPRWRALIKTFWDGSSLSSSIRPLVKRNAGLMIPFGGRSKSGAVHVRRKGRTIYW